MLAVLIEYHEASRRVPQIAIVLFHFADSYRVSHSVIKSRLVGWPEKVLKCSGSLLPQNNKWLLKTDEESGFAILQSAGKLCEYFLSNVHVTFLLLRLTFRNSVSLGSVCICGLSLSLGVCAYVLPSCWRLLEMQLHSWIV